MAQIKVTDLTFAYEGSADDVLQDVTFSVDTDWKLGLIGRNRASFYCCQKVGRA